MARQWFARFRKWSENEAWGFVFSDHHGQHLFSLGETEGSQGDEASWKPRIGVFVYFEVWTDTLGLQSAKIVRRASKEESHRYMFGPPRDRVIHSQISDCTRKRTRPLLISLCAALDLSLDL
jgi:hypothetical protein